MLYVILIAVILPIIEVFLYKKNKKLAWIIPIITGIYLVYSYYNIVKVQDLTYIDMLPSIILFVPNMITFIVCKIIIKK